MALSFDSIINESSFRACLLVILLTSCIYHYCGLYHNGVKSTYSVSVVWQEIYRKVANRSTSRLVAPSRIFRLLMKGKICAFYLLGKSLKFKKNQFWELAILKNSVLLSRPFWNFFFQKKKKRILFASSPWKSVKATFLSRMGRNFDDYPGLQQKSKCA